MTDAQIFQLFGIVLVALGLSWIVNHGAYRRLIKDLAKSESVLLLMGIVSLVVGYALLVLHTTQSVIITVLGWLSILKGITIIFFPAFGWNVYSILNTMKKYFSFMPWLVLVIGLLCLYVGYWA